MSRPYIEKLRIENYGCVQDAELQLSPLHALIGPNDSGKSTVLRALKTLTRVAQGFPDKAPGEWERILRELRYVERDRRVSFRVTHGRDWWSFSVADATFTERTAEGDGTIRDSTRPSELLKAPAMNALAQTLRGATFLRADPDSMREPWPVILEGQPTRFFDERGHGLAPVYDAIFGSNPETYLAINKRLRELFPPVKGIALRNRPNFQKVIGVTLHDETFVPAESMSEGLLYFLAFAALPYLDPTSLLLVEEPENGLHPARIVEVIRILRDVSKTMQVVLATHSPLVINELEGHEVTVLTRTVEQGTKARLLKDTFNYEERSKVYANGELWLSYSNGEDERDLFQAPEAAQ